VHRRPIVAWLLLGLLLIAGSGCKAERSSCNSLCARCGRSLHTNTVNGNTTSTIREGDLSKWLAGYIPNPCQHVWIPVSGWSSSNNLAWDGVSRWHSALVSIKKLSLTVGETETRELLERYYELLGMADKTQQADLLKTFCGELKDTLD